MASLFLCLSTGFLEDYLFGQDLRPRVVLKQPGDVEFDSLLNDNFPGIANLEGFKAIRPFMVLLRNDSQKRVMAYVVKWDVQRNKMQPTSLMTQYIQEPFSAYERRAFVPREIRLITHFFNIDPAQYKSGHNNFAKLMAATSSGKDYSSEYVTSVRPSIDVVIYEDGSSDGPDEFGLLKRYACFRDVEREFGENILNLLDSSVPIEEVIERLKRESQMDRETYRAKGATQSIDPFCFFHRVVIAKAFLSSYRRGGPISLRKQALGIASSSYQ